MLVKKDTFKLDVREALRQLVDQETHPYVRKHLQECLERINYIIEAEKFIQQGRKP